VNGWSNIVGTAKLKVAQHPEFVHGKKADN
jgi:hypothetical protein